MALGARQRLEHGRVVGPLREQLVEGLDRARALLGRDLRVAEREQELQPFARLEPLAELRVELLVELHRARVIADLAHQLSAALAERLVVGQQPARAHERGDRALRVVERPVALRGLDAQLGCLVPGSSSSRPCARS